MNLPTTTNYNPLSRALARVAMESSCCNDRVFVFNCLRTVDQIGCQPGKGMVDDGLLVRKTQKCYRRTPEEQKILTRRGSFPLIPFFAITVLVVFRATVSAY